MALCMVVIGGGSRLEAQLLHKEPFRRAADHTKLFHHDDAGLIFAHAWRYFLAARHPDDQLREAGAGEMRYRVASAEAQVDLEHAGPPIVDEQVCVQRTRVTEGAG